MITPDWLQEVFDRVQETIKNSDDWRKKEEPQHPDDKKLGDEKE